MDDMRRNLLDEYRASRWETESTKEGKNGGFWITLSAIVILLAGFVFCANNKLLRADEFLEKIRNLQIGSITVSQIYESVVGEESTEASGQTEETPLG